MSLLCRIFLLWSVALAAAAASAQAPLKLDRSRSFVDVDVSATVGSFTGRLEKFQVTMETDAAGKIRAARVDFRFADLKTGDADRDARLLEWLGSPDATGRFDLGVLALTPDGQGHANGRLTFHGTTQRVEFPVNVTRKDDAYTVVGEVTLDYRHWGLKPLRHRVVVKVAPEVKVRFQVVGTLPPPADE